MIFDKLKLKKSEEVVVRDVEEFLEKIEDVIPVNEDNNALVEAARWIMLTQKVIDVTKKKMKLEEAIDTMAIIEFIANKEVENLYRYSVAEIAKTLVETGEKTDVVSLMRKPLGKKIRGLAWVTGKSVDEVLADIRIGAQKLHENTKKRK